VTSFRKVKKFMMVVIIVCKYSIILLEIRVSTFGYIDIMV